MEAWKAAGIVALLIWALSGFHPLEGLLKKLFRRWEVPDYIPEEWDVVQNRHCDRPDCWRCDDH